MEIKNSDYVLLVKDEKTGEVKVHVYETEEALKFAMEEKKNLNSLGLVGEHFNNWMEEVKYDLTALYEKIEQKLNEE